MLSLLSTNILIGRFLLLQARICDQKWMEQGIFAGCAPNRGAIFGRRTSLN